VDGHDCFCETLAEEIELVTASSLVAEIGGITAITDCKCLKILSKEKLKKTEVVILLCVIVSFPFFGFGFCTNSSGSLTFEQ